MFDQMKAIKQLLSQLGNPEELQEKAQQMQEELGRRTVIGDAGAGAVRVTLNGRFECQRVEIDPSMVQTLAGGEDDSEADRSMIEELLRSATNDAIARAQELAKEEMSKLTGGVNLAGLDPNLLDGGG